VESYGVILFHTTSSVMCAEKALAGEGCVVKLIPTPREFSSDCGIALRFDWDEYEKVTSLVAAAQLEINAIHRM